MPGRTIPPKDLAVLGNGPLEKGDHHLADRASSLFMVIYSFSTCLRAHGVFLKNLRLDATDGSLLKQRISIRLPSTGQP